MNEIKYTNKQTQIDESSEEEHFKPSKDLVNDLWDKMWTKLQTYTVPTSKKPVKTNKHKQTNMKR